MTTAPITEISSQESDKGMSWSCDHKGRKRDVVLWQRGFGLDPSRRFNMPNQREQEGGFKPQTSHPPVKPYLVATAISFLLPFLVLGLSAPKIAHFRSLAIFTEDSGIARNSGMKLFLSFHLERKSPFASNV